MGKMALKEEKELVERICSGDESAFRLFVDTYKDRIYGYLYRLIANEADREEVCQDVFVKAYLNIKGFRFESALSTWLYRVAWHAAVSHLRKTKTMKSKIVSTFQSRNGLDEELLFNSMDTDQIDDDTAFVDTLNQEVSELVKEEISCLAPQERSILTLYHFLELGIADIGEIMAKPEGTIKSDLYRIRKKLKESIQLRLPDEYLALAREGVQA